MSVKVAKQEKKKNNSKFIKWILVALFIIVLEVGAIFSSVKISESRNLKQNEQFQLTNMAINNQNSRLDVLEKLPLIISENAKKINTISSTLSLFSDNLVAMQQTVNKETIDGLNNALQEMNNKIEAIEETKNNEALVLSVALIIKENALYNRNFSKDVDILTDLASNQPNIQNDISTLNNMKNEIIENDISLINSFNSFADELVFEEQTDKQNTNTNDNAVAKSIKLIKDTVSGINFDKVVILKKDKKTNEQKALIAKLKELVVSNNFSGALDLIHNNPQFNSIKNETFATWQSNVKKNIVFNEAISHIISSELSAIRTNFDKTKEENVTIKE